MAKQYKTEQKQINTFVFDLNSHHVDSLDCIKGIGNSVKCLFSILIELEEEFGSLKELHTKEDNSLRYFYFSKSKEDKYYILKSLEPLKRCKKETLFSLLGHSRGFQSSELKTKHDIGKKVKRLGGYFFVNPEEEPFESLSESGEKYHKYFLGDNINGEYVLELHRLFHTFNNILKKIPEIEMQKAIYQHNEVFFSSFSQPDIEKRTKYNKYLKVGIKPL